MPCVGILSTRMTTKLYLCIGLLFTAASFFGSYWSVQTSLPLTVVTYGMLGGVPHAILYPGCINIALRWVPEHRGLITGLVLTGYGLGAVAWNQLTTCYINLDNLEPDVTVGEDKYFSQSSVLDRVPSCFLLVGTIFTAGLLVCVLVICDPPVPPVPPVPPQVVIITKSSAEKENLIPHGG
ncbi:uncharacterized protein [Littorina saxatilis]|uniref:uncharacterized protein n=1 Tax=Littorina saxatilis TaxID=31220 RepID=UPI0038B4A59B